MQQPGSCVCVLVVGASPKYIKRYQLGWRWEVPIFPRSGSEPQKVDEVYVSHVFVCATTCTTLLQQQPFNVIKIMKSGYIGYSKNES